LIPSADKTLKICPGCYHELHKEPKEFSDPIIQEIIDWIVSRAKSAVISTSSNQQTEKVSESAQVSDAKSESAPVSDAKSESAPVSDAKSESAQVSDAKSENAQVSEVKTESTQVSDVKSDKSEEKSNERIGSERDSLT